MPLHPGPDMPHIQVPTIPPYDSHPPYSPGRAGPPPQVSNLDGPRTSVALQLLARPAALLDPAGLCDPAAVGPPAADCAAPVAAGACVAAMSAARSSSNFPRDD